jgi:predicted transcriptional regulator
MSRRTHTEIITDILTEALKGASKTRIMYRANLNFLRFKRYFSELESKGLIAVVKNPGRGIVYQTTEKGKDLLQILNKAGLLMSP